MSGRVTAQEAMQEARDAKMGLESHEAVCAERYKAIFSTLADLKTIAKWAAAGVAGLAVSLIAWMGVQLYTANNARLSALEDGPSQTVVVQQPRVK